MNPKQQIKVFQNHGIPTAAFFVNIQREIDIKKHVKYFQDASKISFYTVRYITADKIVREQFDFHLEIIKKLEEREIFNYDVKCFLGDDLSFIVYNSKAEQIPTAFAAGKWNLLSLQRVYFDIIRVFDFFESTKAVFTYDMSTEENPPLRQLGLEEMFIFTSKIPLQLDPRILAYVYRAGKPCYIAKGSYFANPKSLTKSAVDSEQGFRFFITIAETSWHPILFLHLIDGVRSDSLSKKLHSEEEENFHKFKTTIMALKLYPTVFPVLNFGWNDIIEFLKLLGQSGRLANAARKVKDTVGIAGKSGLLEASVTEGVSIGWMPNQKGAKTRRSSTSSDGFEFAEAIPMPAEEKKKHQKHQVSEKPAPKKSGFSSIFNPGRLFG